MAANQLVDLRSSSLGAKSKSLTLKRMRDIQAVSGKQSCSCSLTVTADDSHHQRWQVFPHHCGLRFGHASLDWYRVGGPSAAHGAPACVRMRRPHEPPSLASRPKKAT